MAKHEITIALSLRVITQALQFIISKQKYTCTFLKDNHLCTLGYIGKNESNICTLVKDNHLCTLGYTGKMKVTLVTSVKDNHLCPLDHTGKNKSNTHHFTAVLFTRQLKLLTELPSGKNAPKKKECCHKQCHNCFSQVSKSHKH